MANRLAKNGKKVVVAAADTFRAAAVEQLEIWAKRAGADIVKRDEGVDPASVVYDAIKNASPDEKLVQLKSLETLSEVAKGSANKIFIPFEATSTLSSLGAMKDVITDTKAAAVTAAPQTAPKAPRQTPISNQILGNNPMQPKQ